MSEPALEAVGISADEVMTCGSNQATWPCGAPPSARLGPSWAEDFRRFYINGDVMIVAAGSGHSQWRARAVWARASAGALRGGAGTYGAALRLALCLQRPPP